MSCETSPWRNSIDVCYRLACLCSSAKRLNSSVDFRVHFLAAWVWDASDILLIWVTLLKTWKSKWLKFSWLKFSRFALEHHVLVRTNLLFGENLENEAGVLSSPTRVFKHCAVTTSQIRHRPSWLEDKRSVPSWLKSTAVMGSEWAWMTLKHEPVRVSQRRTHSSKLPLAIRFMCGLNAAQNTNEVCPFNSRTHRPDLVSYILNVLSSEQVNTYRSSGLKQISLMPWTCPLYVISCFIVAMFHRLAVLSAAVHMSMFQCVTFFP